MSKIIQSKICPCCLKRFFKKKNHSIKQWRGIKCCSIKCSKIKVPIEDYKQQRLQEILTNTIVTSTGCMEWQGYIGTDGYGSVAILKKYKHAHLHVWEILHNELTQNIHVLHKCDNRKCINPEHLFLGTHQDNVKDMVSKGRQAVGGNHGKCKIHGEKKRQLIEMAKKGVLYKEIACQLNLNETYIGIYLRKNGMKRYLCLK